jgi:hypothetical protein
MFNFEKNFTSICYFINFLFKLSLLAESLAGRLWAKLPVSPLAANELAGPWTSRRTN